MFSDLQYLPTASVPASHFSGITHWLRSSAKTNAHCATVVKAELFLHETPEASTESHYLALPENTAINSCHCLLLGGIFILCSGSSILLAQKSCILFPFKLTKSWKELYIPQCYGPWFS